MLDLSLMETHRPIIVPAWLTTVVSTAGEIILLIITLAIISAMWLPAYLTGNGSVNRLAQPDMQPRMPRHR